MDKNEGYWALPKSVASRVDLSYGAKILFAVLNSYSHMNNHCYQGSNDTLRIAVGAASDGDRYIRRLLQELETKGFIRRVGRGNSRRIYVMSNSIGTKCSDGTDKSSVQNVPMKGFNGTKSTTSTEHFVPHNNKENKSNNNYNNAVFALFAEESEQKITDVVRDTLTELVNAVGEKWVIEAIKDAARKGNGKCNASYIKGTIINWCKSGKEKPWKREMPWKTQQVPPVTSVTSPNYDDDIEEFGDTLDRLYPSNN